MEELFQDIKYYIDLRIKRFKLNMVDNLSAFCSRAISLTAFLLMLLLAMLTLTGALVAAVALWIGSLIWAFVIVGGFYLIAALLLSASGQALYRRYGEDVQQDVFREQF